ncbi:HV01 protein, partial [Pachyramphus minor]|nr:HV01 protein [Pachyramphus minor]
GLWAQLRLEETGGGQREPGESVLLSCRGSGSMDKNVLWWYRQAPGGSPDWVSVNGLDSSLHEYGPAVKGRALRFTNESQSEVYLSLWALQPQDSARYFCAVHTRT